MFMMTRRSSISNSTKKFIRKTLESFKTFLFSVRYQKLPKDPNFKPFSCCMGSRSPAKYRDDLDKFYDEFISMHEDSYQKITEKKNESRNNESSISSSSSSPTEQEKQIEGGSPEKNERRCVDEDQKECRCKDLLLVEVKLRELRKMEMSNVDHILDIEEILHYYSRLTCPAYLGIVDKLFMEIYSEFFGEAATVKGN